MTEMVFKFKDAAHFRAGFDRAAGADRLSQMLAERGHLSTEAIIEEGLRAESPLHPQFDFTPDEALLAAYERQAYHLQRSFVAVVFEDDGASREIRAVVPVFTRDSPDDRQFIATAEALSDDDYRDQVLFAALKELEALERKYRDLRELARVFTAIRTASRVIRKAA